MARQVMLSDNVVRKLDEVKKELNGASYSKAIERLLEVYESNPRVTIFNKRIEQIQGEFPELHEVMEYLRIIGIKILNKGGCPLNTNTTSNSCNKA